ncbi:hypothetical protein PoB_001161600 [Plakobranchus ocellatus]|uniref:Uncharacterized protein n=1 Tax=Plakobranchus ocellatus TaxID=259542 RepID=A0AAV3YPA7_9GAST|nr:hypothetical protein PoB_001161600 [Plakobranchus ocellatus]
MSYAFPTGEKTSPLPQGVGLYLNVPFLCHSRSIPVNLSPHPENLEKLTIKKPTYVTIGGSINIHGQDRYQDNHEGDDGDNDHSNNEGNDSDNDHSNDEGDDGNDHNNDESDDSDDRTEGETSTGESDSE